MAGMCCSIDTSAKLVDMPIEIPHEHHQGRRVLQVGMVVSVNSAMWRVIDSTDTHTHLTPLKAEREEDRL